MKNQTTTPTKLHPRPPAGLVAAFAMIQPELATSIAATSSARDAYGPALQIIDLLHADADRDEEVEERAQDVAIARVLDRATVAMHGKVWEGAEKEPSLTRDTAFRVGFAVCWLLMTDVAGMTRGIPRGFEQMDPADQALVEETVRQIQRAPKVPGDRPVSGGVR